jgi:CheY-like chemotaxis protein
MLIDDDPIFRLLVKKAAQSLGLSETLVLCESLKQADDCLQTQRPDFWVIDVNLKDGLGPEWLLQQRQAGRTQPAQLISHSDLQDVDLATLKPCEFRRKPGQWADLCQWMKGWSPK